MAKTTQVILTDDLDGSEGADTVSFSWEGQAYEIELSEKNRAKLEKAITPFVQGARRASVSPQMKLTRVTSGSGRSKDDLAAIRDWARKNDLQVSDRGRISADVLEKFDAAH